MTNITSNITQKMRKDLHNNVDHPVGIIKNIIYKYLNIFNFTRFDNLSPIVSVEDNFDKLLIPKDHISRNMSDTYYVTNGTVLRTHTSAHQNQLLSQGETCFLVTGDVYRKDTVDASHYPIFHQMEGVMLFDKDANVEGNLKEIIKGIINCLFPDCKYILREDKFPFTNPSWEVDVLFNGEWLEILGCGIIHEEILNNCGLSNKTGWAFGLGLDRLAMILFDIPDIRYLWSEDKRFLNQFKSGKLIKFKPFSKYPLCRKDISFWINDNYSENDFHCIAREVGGDLIESITLIDSFTHPVTKRNSNAYTITYRSHSRSLTNDEINIIQNNLRNGLLELSSIELR